MHSTWPRGFARLAAFLSLTLVLVPALESPAQDAGNSMTGEAVMDAYVEAIGGKEALENVKTRQTEGSFSMPAAQVTASIKMTQEAPNKLRMEMTIPGLGSILQISDGENVYSKDPITGERMLTGSEKEAAKIEANISSEANWREVYKSVKLLGDAKVDGRDVVKVELVTKGGLKRTNFFDKENHLLVMSEMTVESPQGKIQTVSRFKDFKTVDGLKVPHLTEIEMLGQKQVITLSSVKHGVDVPAGTFDIPKL